METAEQLGYEVRVYARVPNIGYGRDRRKNNMAGSQSSSSMAVESEGYNRRRATRNPGAVQYRQQGVDELLPLKLHQTIAAVDVPPSNATIIIATGNGNLGSFSVDVLQPIT